MVKIENLKHMKLFLVHVAPSNLLYLIIYGRDQGLKQVLIEMELLGKVIELELEAS
jgi:hypothetical protein